MRSRGYTPMELERIQSRLSHEALGLLIRLRTESGIRQMDGLVEDASVAAIAAYFGTKPARTRQLLHELEDAGAIISSPRGVIDAAYGTWCRLNAEREELRRKWIDRQKLSRDPELRRAIRERDGDRCQYCGIEVNWSDRRGPTGATYDHVQPDGPSTLENLVVACRQCNTRKGNLPLPIFLDRWNLRFRVSLMPSLDRNPVTRSSDSSSLSLSSESESRSKRT